MKKQIPGENALEFKASEVSWATSKFIDKRIAFAQRVFIHTLTSTLLILGLYSYFSKIALSITAKGKLVSSGTVVKVKAQGNFQVDTLNFKNGDEINKGQTIATSKFAISQNQQKNIIQLSNQLLLVIDKAYQNSCKECLIEIESFQNNAFKDLTNNPIHKQLMPSLVELEQLQSAFVSRDNFNINNKDLFSTIRNTTDKIDRIIRGKNKRLLNVELENLKQRRDTARSQIKQKQEQLNSNLNNYLTRTKNSLSSLASIMEQFNRQNQLIAPKDGIVNASTLQEGGLVQAGAVALEIIPNNVNLKGELYILNKDIGEIKPQMNVKLNITAYPEREFGAVYGFIESIDPDTTQIKGLGSVYKAFVKLEKNFVVKNNKKYPFKLGMGYEGKVIKKRERLLIVGIRKLLNLKDDIFGN